MGNRYTEDRTIPEICVDGSGCWIWTGDTNKNGYARWWKRGDDYGRVSHAVIWETFNGKKPLDMQLDHLCGVERCVNPLHLELVKSEENLRRRNRSNGWIGQAQPSRKSNLDL